MFRTLTLQRSRYRQLSFVSPSVILLIIIAGFSGVVNAQAPPNIIVIFTDDQGSRDVGCYGSEFPTPHIDRLASEGMKFTNFYAASAICTPSRFGFLTGKNPSRSNDRLLSALMFEDKSHGKLGIHASETSLPQVLKTAGYQTALLGKWHLGHGDSEFSPLQHGFDYFYGHTAGCVDYFTMDYGNTPDWYRNDVPIDETGYATDLISKETISYLEKRDTKKPFFLFLAYNAPHFGKGWDDGNDKSINLLQPHPRDLERVKDITDPSRRKYAAMVVALDDGIGEVLGYLDKAGIAENTLVIFMSDHGGDPNYGGSNGALRAGKATLFEGGTKVPCIVRWPGKVKPNIESKAVTWALDWFPTLASIGGASTNDVLLDGKNITTVLTGNTPLAEREMYWELGSHAELERGHWVAYRTGNWKYVNTPNEGEWLFNLQTDPFEKQNLKEQEVARFDQLRARCTQFGDTYKKYSVKK
jgi:arylsulfatase A-like enzyme